VGRYLFSSHDGFGVGHLRRNTLVARSLLAQEPGAEVAIVTGLAVRPAWLRDLRDGRITVTRVPPLVKDSEGAYRNEDLSFEAAIARRAAVFDQTVASFAPDIVVVDRHPYGLAGELRPGLERAARSGAAVVLGLRDVLDEPAKVAEEVAGDGWVGVEERFDEILVYGAASFCNHEREYGLPGPVTYCGWVVDDIPARPRDPELLVVTAGGGGDGLAVYRLGVELAARLPWVKAVLVAGPYAAQADGQVLVDDDELRARVRVLRDRPGCADLFARAGSIVQMAGYNSTFESLRAGIRPVLVPRRSPRREQAIRASRLAALGLADVVDEGASADEVAWLLGRSRLLPEGALADAGIHLDGADRAASRLTSLARVAVA
jgi:predicted glycosyltransferase